MATDYDEQTRFKAPEISSSLFNTPNVGYVEKPVTSSDPVGGRALNYLTDIVDPLLKGAATIDKIRTKEEATDVLSEEVGTYRGMSPTLLGREQQRLTDLRQAYDDMAPVAGEDRYVGPNKEAYQESVQSLAIEIEKSAKLLDAATKQARMTPEEQKDRYWSKVSSLVANSPAYASDIISIANQQLKTSNVSNLWTQDAAAMADSAKAFDAYYKTTQTKWAEDPFRDIGRVHALISSGDRQGALNEMISQMIHRDKTQEIVTRLNAAVEEDRIIDDESIRVLQANGAWGDFVQHSLNVADLEIMKLANDEKWINLKPEQQEREIKKIFKEREQAFVTRYASLLSGSDFSNKVKEEYEETMEARELEILDLLSGKTTGEEYAQNIQNLQSISEVMLGYGNVETALIKNIATMYKDYLAIPGDLKTALNENLDMKVHIAQLKSQLDSLKTTNVTGSSIGNELRMNLDNVTEDLERTIQRLENVSTFEGIYGSPEDKQKIKKEATDRYVSKKPHLDNNTNAITDLTTSALVYRNAMHPHNHNPKIKNEAAKVFHGLIASYMNDTAEGSNNLEDLPTQKHAQIFSDFLGIFNNTEMQEIFGEEGFGIQGTMPGHIKEQQALIGAFQTYISPYMDYLTERLGTLSKNNDIELGIRDDDGSLVVKRIGKGYERLRAKKGDIGVFGKILEEGKDLQIQQGKMRGAYGQSLWVSGTQETEEINKALRAFAMLNGQNSNEASKEFYETFLVPKLKQFINENDLDEFTEDYTMGDTNINVETIAQQEEKSPSFVETIIPSAQAADDFTTGKGPETLKKTLNNFTRTGVSFTENEFITLSKAVGEIESRGSGGKLAVGKSKTGGIYFGKYQMGKGAIGDSAIDLNEEIPDHKTQPEEYKEWIETTFLQDEDMQERYYGAYLNKVNRYLMGVYTKEEVKKNKLSKSLIGKERSPGYVNASTKRKLEYLAGSQLGMGNIKDYIAGDRSFRDGNKKSISYFINRYKKYRDSK